MTTSNHLGFSFILQSQSQKEVTANAALSAIDAILNTGAIDKDLATPPGSPAAGDVYIVAGSATGAWAGKDGQIAYYDSGWRFIDPNEGLALWVNDEDKLYIYNGSAWAKPVLTEYLSGTIATPADGDYTLLVDAPYAMTITEAVTQSTAGTATATFKINSTALGGTANSVSTSKQAQAHASANAAAAGDAIVLTISSNSGSANLAWRLAYTRSL